jgi:four helix bundle protein
MTTSSKRRPIQNHRDLDVWQRAMDLADFCYDVTENFPKREIYGLASQIRRAAVSIAANIAEGHGRHHTGDYLHHVSYSTGSLMELDTEVRLAQRRKFLPVGAMERFVKLYVEVGSMLRSLTASLRKHQESQAR